MFFSQTGPCLDLGTAHDTGTFECAPGRHVVPAWTKLGARTHFLPSGAQPISNVARRVGSVIQPVRRAVPHLIPEELGTRFHLAVARNVEYLFLRPPTMFNPVAYATRYALQSERDCIAQLLDVAETLHVLADAVYSENLQALRLVDLFLLPVVAKRNLLVMREVSVVISWMDPKFVVDSFFCMPQLEWAMPVPTMRRREAPPEYPIEALSRLWRPQIQINFSVSPLWR